MLKARAGNLVILGLSDLNIERIEAGKPIVFDSTEVGIAGYRFLIFHGKTELEMQEELIKHGYLPPPAAGN